MTSRPHPDPPRPRLVVVGSGMAATRLVEELVARGAPARMEITVLGDEDTAPYNRILLSAVLEGSHRPEALTLRDPAWYADNGVDLRLGARVLGVDRERKDVMLVDGTLVEYDVLVLATGSIPSLPPIRGLVRMDGSLHEAVHAFRSLADCRRLLSALPYSRRAVVVGGGLLGLQVARALGVRGIETEVVEGADHLLHQQLSAPAARILARDLKKLGVAVYTGARAVRLVEGATGPALRLDNGFTLDTDLVVLTAGGRPSTALARGAGLEVRRGIVVDDRLASVTDPSVHALGDCVEHDGRTTGFVPPAWEQAGILAGLLCDEQVLYDGARIVARLRATDLDVAVLGDAEAELAAGGEVVEVANPVSGSHRRLVVRDGRIVAATLVGDLSRVGLITQHFDRQTVLGPHEPGDLLLPERTPGSTRTVVLPDDAEVCACAGVTAGRIRACSSLEQVRGTTRATTGCGGCASTVRQLLSSRPDNAVLVTKGS
ncbi:MULTISPECIES: FAD-dependent oxidoreductase [unclassified Nocardioides]|uniref:FAD-dependent oxidoreductase n=1 Tax=unclassified Nocardioides TaxID=2615069 RepID=UPI0011546BDC|nr:MULTISPECIES: FAD-dependent oxidoreductase [unclassified Nocardioides]TQK68315.1 assimilatory nitrate reductase (NADH) beta subunit [Nocardioides sp. SLBN-35]WGY02368.1 FAD-dependent oxidoreductase [Nocardioides sp. QY071]